MLNILSKLVHYINWRVVNCSKRVNLQLPQKRSFDLLLSARGLSGLLASDIVHVFNYFCSEPDRLVVGIIYYIMMSGLCARQFFSLFKKKYCFCSTIFCKAVFRFAASIFFTSNKMLCLFPRFVQHFGEKHKSEILGLNI